MTSQFDPIVPIYQFTTKISGATIAEIPSAARIGDMSTPRNTDEFEGSPNTTDVRPRNSSRQHAIEAWENEGGSAAGPPAPGGVDQPRTALADEEDRILRYLGAAVIMRWNTIPTKLQRELFDNASSMGELLKAGALKGQIARFLHKHKDDAV